MEIEKNLNVRNDEKVKRLSESHGDVMEIESSLSREKEKDVTNRKRSRSEVKFVVKENKKRRDEKEKLDLVEKKMMVIAEDGTEVPFA